MHLLVLLKKEAVLFVKVRFFLLKDRKSTRLNSSHSQISYAVFCLKKKVLCDGRVVADHERLWAKHQNLSDTAHVAAANVFTREHVEWPAPRYHPRRTSAVLPPMTT